MDRQRFYTDCSERIEGFADQATVGCDLIISEASKRGTPVNQLAYILATSWWETAKTMQPVREAFYLSENLEKVEAWRKKNLHYYPYYGRGFIQLTWKANYKKASEKLGQDFVSDPDKVMKTEYAVPVLFDGMEEGWFTGKSLDDYIDDIDEPDTKDLQEYKKARKVVNGTDKAETIAKVALKFESALKTANYGHVSVDALSFATKLVEKASTELKNYKGLTEGKSPLKERIGDYWNFLDRPDLDGSDHSVPWSAAFISYMMYLAGAGKTFPYSTQHSVYLYRAINDLLKNEKSSFWGYRVDGIKIKPGDVLGMNRATANQIDYDWAAHHSDYKSHADIVVRVDSKGVHVIGGNIGSDPGQITTKLFIWKDGQLINSASKNQSVFVIIRSFLP